jgi:uncharacterized membrane protein YcaP (DUF421 family)
MDAVVRAFVVYLFLLVLFQIIGRRSLTQITTFDLVVLLIVSEATQQALLGQDYSVVNAFLVILTLLGLEALVLALTWRWNFLDRWVNSAPLVLIQDGEPIDDRLKNANVDESDILEQARSSQGLERLDQIKYAVLERNGAISIIPKSGD